MPHRYFTRELADGRAALTGSDAHHLADVMRARIGEEVVLCGPDGLEYLGTVTAIEPGRVEFSVTDGTTSKAEPDCAVTLFAGYPKAGKLEEVIRHSVELGVTEVVPFFSRYCVATPKKEDVKNERYNRIAAEAAKQAGRAMLPHVALPLNDFAAVCKAFADFDVVLFFYEGGGAPLREVLHPGQYKRVAIVTGSEGGFSVEEAEAAKAEAARLAAQAEDPALLTAAVALALGIGVQNFPEGAIISLPLRSESGMSRKKAFAMGTLSGIVEPIGALATIAAYRYLEPVLPVLLALAAGAMIYVVVEELIPESAQGSHSDMGTIGFAVGFVLMMILDVALG